jgi:hypothetical protein
MAAFQTNFEKTTDANFGSLALGRQKNQTDKKSVTIFGKFTSALFAHQIFSLKKGFNLQT